MMKNESNRTLKLRGESEIMLEPEIERNHALVLFCSAFQNIKFLGYQIDISHFVRQRNFQRSLEKSTNKKYQKTYLIFNKEISNIQSLQKAYHSLSTLF